MTRKFFLRKEAKSLGAAQILIGLFHSAMVVLLGVLYTLEDPDNSIGPSAMMILIIYALVSGIFFITSGSSSVIQGSVTSCKLIFAIVMNILSLIVAIFGLIILFIEFSLFEAKGVNYIWSNMAGMMLLQFLLLSTIAQLTIGSITIHWMKKAFKHEIFDEQMYPPLSREPSNQKCPTT